MSILREIYFRFVKDGNAIYAILHMIQLLYVLNMNLILYCLLTNHWNIIIVTGCIIIVLGTVSLIEAPSVQESTIRIDRQTLTVAFDVQNTPVSQ